MDQVQAESVASVVEPQALGVQGGEASHTLQCMEIWGGNEPLQTHLTSPGLDVWINSQPHPGAQQGGDITYVSMCGSGRIARFAVADVAGHGEDVGDLARMLRKLMRKHINQLNQARFARALNREFQQLADAGRFATAILTTYFAPTDHLVIVNAGHPRPLWYQAASGAWRLIDPDQIEHAHTLEFQLSLNTLSAMNLPLGIIEPTDYAQFAVKLAPGDLVLVYTDSLIEAIDPNGRQLGETGLIELVQQLDVSDPAVFNDAVLAAVARWRGGQAARDDQTLLVMHHNGSEPPPMTFSQAVRSLAKMMGLSRV